jgi:hypothetical protein
MGGLVQSYNLKGLNVFIAMPVKDEVHPKTVIALMDTMTLLREKGIPHKFAFQIGGTLCGGVIPPLLHFSPGRLIGCCSSTAT